MARGTRLGRYELLGPIGSGGMAHVWLARLAGEGGFQRLVAIKMIHPEHASDASFRAMFLDEARLAARIHHANVVDVVELGEDSARVYQVMPLIDGASLSTLMQKLAASSKSLSPRAALRVVADAARGLHAAHELRGENGVPLQLVHRDVSPHNILVGQDGVSRIADFGIAKVLDRSRSETNAGELKGKISYMSPEQVERFIDADTTPLDRRTDVFALGIVLWEALTGKPLFRGREAFDALTRIRKQPIADPREHVPTLPKDVAEACLRALARPLDERFQTAEELADALEATGHVGSAKEVGATVRACAGAEIDRRRAMAQAADLEPTVVAPPPAASDRAVDSERTLRGTAGSVRGERSRRSGLVVAVVVTLAVASALASAAFVVRREGPREHDVANGGAPPKAIGIAPVTEVPSSGSAPQPTVHVEPATSALPTAPISRPARAQKPASRAAASGSSTPPRSYDPFAHQ